MFLAAMAAVGGALSLYGTIKGANDQADAVERNSALKRQQADELMARQEINEQIIREQSEKSSLSYGASFAGTGREGAGIGGILQIHRDAQEQILNTRRDAEFKARQLREGADIQSDLASDSITSAWIGAAGGLLATGASTYKAMSPPGGTTQSLPGVP